LTRDFRITDDVTEKAKVLAKLTPQKLIRVLATTEACYSMAYVVLVKPDNDGIVGNTTVVDIVLC